LKPSGIAVLLAARVVTSDPQFSDLIAYELKTTSPAVDRALLDTLTPAMDLRGFHAAPHPTWACLP
jgi:hypothetical protein